MAERVLANPLSGEEIRKAVLDKISQALERDCYLSPNLAYDYFSAKVRIELTAHDLGREAAVTTEVQVTEGDNPDEMLDQAEAEFEMTPQPPNEVRVDTGQPVPVLTRDAEGKPEVKPVKYGRSRLAKMRGV